MNQVLDNMITAFFPQHCAACARVIKPKEWWCEDCVAEFPKILPPICPYCGMEKPLCTCDKQRHAYDSCCSPFYKEGVADQAIQRFKFDDLPRIAHAFAPYMASVILREYADCMPQVITFVPEYEFRPDIREYNPGGEMAKAVAKRLGIPCRPLLDKIYPTKPQKELPAIYRSGNLLGAFDVSKGARVRGKTILIVEDVLTTGATLHECAKMLKIAGADKVYAVAAVVTNNGA